MIFRDRGSLPSADQRRFVPLDLARLRRGNARFEKLPAREAGNFSSRFCQRSFSSEASSLLDISRLTDGGFQSCCDVEQVLGHVEGRSVDVVLRRPFAARETCWASPCGCDTGSARGPNCRATSYRSRSSASLAPIRDKSGPCVALPSGKSACE